MDNRSLVAALPVLLILGGVAAPLAVVQFSDPGIDSPALGVRFAPADDPGPAFLGGTVQPASAGDCTLTVDGTVPLENAPATPLEPYARPVAEGAAPTSSAAIAAPADGTAVIIGTELRVGAPVNGAAMGVKISCKPRQDYRSGVSTSAPFHT